MILFGVLEVVVLDLDVCIECEVYYREVLFVLMIVKFVLVFDKIKSWVYLVIRNIS